MHYTVDKETRQEFRRQGAIDLEAVLSEREVVLLRQAVAAALQKRREQQVSRASDAFLLGRDLWRDEPVIAKTVCQRKLAGAATELLGQRPVRLAYDQYLPGNECMIGVGPAYREFLRKENTLQSVSSIREVIGGWLLWLEKSEETRLGNALFLGPATSFPQKAAEVPALLVVYTTQKSLYAEQPKDPHRHTLKRYGYFFGEYLKDALHPILYR